MSNVISTEHVAFDGTAYRLKKHHNDITSDDILQKDSCVEEDAESKEADKEPFTPSQNIQPIMQTAISPPE